MESNVLMPRFYNMHANHLESLYDGDIEHCTELEVAEILPVLISVSILILEKWAASYENSKMCHVCCCIHNSIAIGIDFITIIEAKNSSK